MAVEANPRIRVLVIEDSADLLLLLKVQLGTLGYVVLTARDGNQGLELAESDSPHLIISDLRMPGLNGYEFIKRIRSSPRTARIRAIALTGLGTEEEVEEALAAGFDACLQKSADLGDLSALINKLAMGRRPAGPEG